MLKNNVFDTALIFEGGGMRGSYTAGVVNTLLENEIYFDYVAGISAGSSHCVNYLSRDRVRVKSAFVELVQDPQFGGWKYFFKGEGYFRSEYLYEQTPKQDARFPFDFNTFMENPASLRIGTFDRELGKLDYYSKTDIHQLEDLMKIVRASSSLPLFMPPTVHNGRTYVDGGLAGGIALDVAKRDGYDKFFVVLTQPKGYRKEPLKHASLMKSLYRKYPAMVEAMVNRHEVYNRTLDELETLEAEGKAYLFYPEMMPVSNREINFIKLEESYLMGYRQAQKEAPIWRAFLGFDSAVAPTLEEV